MEKKSLKQELLGIFFKKEYSECEEKRGEAIDNMKVGYLLPVVIIIIVCIVGGYILCFLD